MKRILKMNGQITSSNDYIEGAEFTLSMENENQVKIQIGSTVVDVDKATLLEASKKIEETDFNSGRKLGFILSADWSKEINDKEA